MSLITHFNNISYDNIYFSNPIKNNIKDNSLFYKLIYSDESIVLKNLYFKIKVNPLKVQVESSRASITIGNIAETTETLNDIEANILKQFNGYINASGDRRYTPYYSITDQSSSGTIRIYNVVNICQKKEIFVLLKVSGVWVTKNNIGITYKFIYSNHP